MCIVRLSVHWLFTGIVHVGQNNEETLEELSSRATSRMISGASRRVPTTVSHPVGVESTLPGQYTCNIEFIISKIMVIRMCVGGCVSLDCLYQP